MKGQRLTLTVKQAAKAAGISKGAYYNAVKTGEVPALIVGRRVLVPKAQLEKFLAGDEWKVAQ